MKDNEPPSRHRGQLDPSANQDSPIRRTISNSPRTRSPSQRREDKDFEFGETEDSDSVPESVVHKPPARQHHQASERCRNNARDPATRPPAPGGTQNSTTRQPNHASITRHREYDVSEPTRSTDQAAPSDVMPKDADTTSRTKGLSSARHPSANATGDDRQRKPCWYYQQPSG